MASCSKEVLRALKTQTVMIESESIFDGEMQDRISIYSMTSLVSYVHCVLITCRITCDYMF